MFTPQEKADLDRYITQGPPDDEMWCKECVCDSDDCEYPDEHEDEWITVAEHIRDERFDAYVDAMSEREPG